MDSMYSLPSKSQMHVYLPLSVSLTFFKVSLLFSSSLSIPSSKSSPSFCHVNDVALLAADKIDFMKKMAYSKQNCLILH